MNSCIKVIIAILIVSILTTVSTLSQDLIDDPSQFPLQKDQFMCGERYRLIGDINIDGLNDLILSDDLSYLQ